MLRSAYIPGCYSFNVEILEADKHALFGGAVEEIMALGVSRIETGEVRRRKAAVRRHLAPIDEPTICPQTT